MKKISLIVSGLLLSASMASASVYVSGGTTSFKGGDSGASIAIHGHSDMPITENLYLGFGTGMEYTQAKISDELKFAGEKKAALVWDFTPTLGMKFGKVDVNVLAGYTFGIIEDGYYDAKSNEVSEGYYNGLTYGLNINYNFTKNFGMGANYRHTDLNALDSDKSKDYEADRYSVSLKWTF